MASFEMSPIWSPGSYNHGVKKFGLVIANAIVHRQLYSNMAVIGGQNTEFYVFVQWIYTLYYHL